MEQPNGLITPYAEIRQLEPPQRVVMENGHAPSSQSSLDGHHRQFRSLSQDNYDFLKPTLPSRRSSCLTPSHHHHHHSPLNSTHSSSHFSSQHNNSNIRGGSFSHTMSAASPAALNQSSKVRSRSSKSPSRSPQRNLKAQQSFPTMTELMNSMEGEDADTYVYMARAPLNEIPDSEGEAAKHTPVRAATGGTRTRVTLENVDTDLESGSEVRYRN